MAVNDYLSLIQRNTLVPYSNSGFQRDRWCFAIILMDASVKQIQISVLANSGFEATQYANQLKGYLEANPMAGDDVSIGLRPPIWDPAQHAYKCDMIMMTGNLTITQSRKPVGFGPFSRCLGCAFWTMKSIAHKDEYSFEFKKAFSRAFKMRTTATIGVIDCTQEGTK